MSVKTRLRDALKLRNPTLSRQTDHLVDQATPQLWHTLSTFPSGTSHTPQHTRAVETIASMLLSDDIVARLTDNELAFIILGCHYHDLGMVGTEADNATAEGRERVRREHAISIGDRIIANWQQLGFPDQITAEVLAEICRAHRPTKDSEGSAHWTDLAQHRIVGFNETVRLRLLCAAIYAADELHLGSDRAPKREEDFKRIRNILSLQHWRRHQAVTGPATPENAIEFAITVDTLSFERDIRKVFQKALSAVRDLRRELRAAAITSDVPALRINWVRRELCKLLLLDVGSDLKPRTIEETTDAVVAQFLLEFTDGWQRGRSSLMLVCCLWKKVRPLCFPPLFPLCFRRQCPLQADGQVVDLRGGLAQRVGDLDGDRECAAVVGGPADDPRGRVDGHAAGGAHQRLDQGLPGRGLRSHLVEVQLADGGRGGRRGSDLRRGRVLHHGNGDALGSHKTGGVGKLQHEGLLAELAEGGRPANGLCQFAEGFFGFLGALKKGEDPKNSGARFFGKLLLNRPRAAPYNQLYESHRNGAEVERLIGSFRRECLDHVIILSEAHLKRILSSYLDYYRNARTHLSLDCNTPFPRQVERPANGPVVAMAQVGGLHHRYTRRRQAA